MSIELTASDEQAILAAYSKIGDPYAHIEAGYRAALAAKENMATMSEPQRIDPEVIETAAKARHDAKAVDEGLPFKWHEMPTWHREKQMEFEEAAIRAADEARGLKEERHCYPVTSMPDEMRLVSDWRAVDAA